MDALFSPDGIDPKKWGPALWLTIHALGMNFPLNPTTQQQRAAFAFFDSLCTILPCKFCRAEFCKMTRSGPLKLTKGIFEQRGGDRAGSARLRVFLYTLKLHAAVSVRLGKDPKTLEHWVRFYTAKLRRGVTH